MRRKPLFSFQSLIKEYELDVPYTWTEAGYQDEETGVWQEGVAHTETKRLAIIPVDQRTVYQSGGRITSADRLLYSRFELDARGTVFHEGANWRIEQLGDYTDFADFYRYRLSKEATP